MSEAPAPRRLDERLRDPGFTPGARHFPELFEALASDKERAELAARVLARAGLPAAREALARWPSAVPPARSRLIDVVGRVARVSAEPELVAAIRAALDDADPRTRRSAIRAAVHAPWPELEARLVARWAGAALEERRTLAAALGKIGGRAALDLLSTAIAGDPELERIVAKSKLMLARTLGRTERSRVALDRPLPETASLVLRCRAGVGRILAEEARDVAAVARVEDDEVELPWQGAFGDLLRVRTALDFALTVPLARGSSLEARIVETLAAPAVRRRLAAWTDGTVRFRLAWLAGGHRRATVWRLARAIGERAPELVNDPTRAPWEFVVDERRARLLLCPRGFDDPRFAHRVQAVRGASHPTLAAALAREAGAHEDDVVWDPFAGGGLELIERARLGPWRALHGSDADPGALAVAAENFAAAGVKPTSLVQADARSHRVPDVSLILTNPPMGRRVARHGGLVDLLREFLTNAHRNLRVGGRLVWLSPFPERTARAAISLGFDVSRRETIDMGGFPAELQHCRKLPRRP